MRRILLRAPTACASCRDGGPSKLLATGLRVLPRRQGPAQHSRAELLGAKLPRDDLVDVLRAVADATAVRRPPRDRPPLAPLSRAGRPSALGTALAVRRRP